MTEVCEIAIIGAGPYGLSIAAHLAGAGIPHRIFGKAMDTWATQMPKGMQLKSLGFATSLYAPRGEFSFKDYCRERNIPYADLDIPPRLEDFVAYGRAFQRKFVPELDERMVTGLEQDQSGFVLRLASGPDCRAKAVVVAAGISHFASTPKTFADLPKGLATHSSEHKDLERFKGRKVAVIGAGSSASDIAALLHEAGAEAHLITRGAVVPFHTLLRLPRTRYERIRWPSTVIGASWRSFAMAKAPVLFRLLPLERRLQIVRKYFSAEGGYFMRDRVIGRVNVHLGLEPVRAEPKSGGVHLTLANNGGEEREFQADHVICGTGFKSELARLPFLDANLISRISAFEGTPVLSSSFESSVPGLYFVGAIAANTFGPLLRFACGAEFASARVSRQLRRRHRHAAASSAGQSNRPAPAIAKQPENASRDRA